MSIYKEPDRPVWNAVFFLTLAFLLIYPMWKLGLRDLFWDEGEYAAIVSELHSFPPDARAHGELIPGFYPLYPLLVKGLTMLGLSMEFSLRFISVAALGGLTLMTGIIGCRMAGVHAGAASAAIMFTTLIAAEKAVEGYPDTLLILLIFSGWLLWFFLGQFGGSWKSGWLAIGLFGGLAFYCGGWTALIYFLVPMMFLKRPFTPWRRLTNAGFPAGMLILLFFILIWLIPRWMPEAASKPFFPNYTVWEYIAHGFSMSVDIAFRFLPWTFFLYAPFCAALIDMDENPLFSKYLRILFTVSAILIILSPFSRARDILYLVPTFSLLAGMNYNIVVRRHGQMLCRILRWAALGAFIACSGVLLYELVPAFGIQKFPFLKGFYPEQNALTLSVFSSLLEAAAGILIAGTAYMQAYKKGSIWMITVLVFTSGMLCFYAVITPHRANQRSRSQMGLAFRRALGNAYHKDMTVCKDNAISGLYPECHYLGTRIRTIPFSGTDVLTDKEVYLLSASSIQPPDSSRSWTKIMDVIYKKQNLYMWKGILNDRNDGPENDIRNMRF
ncbi:MAG: hypothetical protein J5858_11390 [Lentisphaeria bacterium]|nr:hypothetical protein [Lentisphaeria bacterium]